MQTILWTMPEIYVLVYFHPVPGRTQSRARPIKGTNRALIGNKITCTV